MTRHRLADDVRLMSELARSALEVADRNGVNTINVASDEPSIRSLGRRRAPQPASDSDAVKKPTHYVIDPARVEQLRPLARILLIQARRQLAREARDAAPGMGRTA